MYDKWMKAVNIQKKCYLLLNDNCVIQNIYIYLIVSIHHKNKLILGAHIYNILILSILNVKHRKSFID